MLSRGVSWCTNVSVGVRLMMRKVKSQPWSLALSCHQPSESIYCTCHTDSSSPTNSSHLVCIIQELIELPCPLGTVPYVYFPVTANSMLKICTIEGLLNSQASFNLPLTWVCHQLRQDVLKDVRVVGSSQEGDHYLLTHTTVPKTLHILVSVTQWVEEQLRGRRRPMEIYPHISTWTKKGLYDHRHTYLLEREPVLFSAILQAGKESTHTRATVP